MHAKTLLFQPVPSGAALPPGNAASLFSGGPGITWEEKRNEFLFMAVRKKNGRLSTG